MKERNWTIITVLFIMLSLCMTNKLTNVNLMKETTAASTWDYTVSNDGVVINGYNGTSKNVVIPDTLEGYTVVKIAANAFEDSEMTSLTIPEGVTSIGDCAFKNCKYLTKINFNAVNCEDCSNGGTYSNSYFYAAFYGAGTEDTGIQVEFGAKVKKVPAYLFATGEDEINKTYANIVKVKLTDSIETIGEGAFYNCYNLTDVTWGNAIVTIEGYAFHNCFELEKVEIPTTTTNIGEQAFKNCKSLTTVNFNAINCADLSSGSTYSNSYFYSAFYRAGIEGAGMNVVFGAQVKKVPAYLFATGEDKIEESYANVVTVTIPNSVESIGDCAFFKCYNLSEVTWGNAIKTIGESTFEDCYKLKSITIPSTTTSIGNCAYKNCKAVATINFNATNCSALSNGSTYSNSYFYAAFYNVGADSESLKVTFGSGVKEIPAYLFSTAEDYNYGSGKFAHITEVVMSDSIEQIGDFAFFNCYKMADVTWGNAVKSFGESSFENCFKLKTLKIPVTTTSIERCAFTNCKALQSIEYNAKNVDDCNYGSIYSDSYYYSSFYNVGADSTALTVTFGSGVKEIPAYLFSTGEAYDYGDGEYAHITSVDMPASVEAIGKYAFKNCFDLKKVNVKSKTVVYGEYSFENIPTTVVFACYRNSTTDRFAVENGYTRNYYDTETTSDLKLKGTYAVSNAKYTVISLSGVPSVSYAPINNEVSSVTIPDTVKINGVTCKVTSIVGNAFKNNKKLKTVTISNNVTSIGTSAFQNCSALTTVKMGSSVETVGTNAFYGCKKLTTLTFGKNVTTIGTSTFQNCIALKKVTLPSKVTSIGTKAFYGCTKLATLTIGVNVTSIGNSAFQNCTSLKKVTIPAKVTKIGSSAFNGCKKMTSITIKTTKLTTKNVGSKAFTKTGSSNYKKLTIKVPKSKLSAYKKLLKSKGLSSKAKVKK